MKVKKIAFIGTFALALAGLIAVQRDLSRSSSHQGRFVLQTAEAAFPNTLRDMIDQTCGACHNNLHLHPPGNYSLNTGASAHTAGVFATSLGKSDPTQMDLGSTDPRTAIIIRKPLDEALMPAHGGIKISSSNPTMVALMDWVSRGAPANELDHPPVAPALAYVNAGGANHAIIYSLRANRTSGFNSLRSSSPGGNLHRLRFNNPNTVTEDINLTNLPGTDDAMNPSVSLDGSKVAFARKQPGQNWQIWEVNSDGSGGLRQITSGAGNKIEPFYLPYLPDGTPARAGEGGIGFLSDAAGFMDEYDVAQTLSLYVCDTNGGHLRQIDFNPSHELHPWLHSSGMLIYTRWEHNEHQGQNSMSLFQISASDYLTAGTGLFGAFGEHKGGDGNSYHEPSEILDASYGQVVASDLLTPVDGNGLFNPSFGKMIARRSDRDDEGGSILGPLFPRLQQTAAGASIEPTTIQVGDMVLSGKDEPDISALTGVTYRRPVSLLNGRFVTSAATLLGTTPQLNFDGTTSYVVMYSSWSLRTFTLDGAGKMANELTLVASAGLNADEAVPLVQKPQPPKIGKPVDLSVTTGVFTSGNVTDRNPNDGQPNSFTVNDVNSIRFIRAIQIEQGRTDTGRRRDDGISTQIMGEAPIAADGSFSAEVPANVPLQFQILDKSGRVLVSHRPWVSVAPGGTERCVGCHARHDKPATLQPLLARQIPPAVVVANSVTQFNFSRDIQPIFDLKCVACHDSAKTAGAAGRRRGLSLAGRETPAHTTESFQSLVGGNYVETQRSKSSDLIWWLNGKCTDVDGCRDPMNSSHTYVFNGTYPTNPAPSVPHVGMLTAAELDKITRWIDTGINFRVVTDDRIGASLVGLDTTTFTTRVWPILNTECYTCHKVGGIGENAMNLDGTRRAENQAELDRNRIEQVSMRSNFMIPNASILLRKPQPPSEGGMTHMGGVHWNKDSDSFKTIMAWIASGNPAAASGQPLTDLISVNAYPNPFRDSASFVYGLTGVVATRVDISIFSQSGKLIRELSGTTIQGATIGWNKVVWDGKDKNGKTVGNDVYFYLLKAEFGDGTKKTFRGKCVKVN